MGDYRIYNVGVWSFVGWCDRGVQVKVDYKVRGKPMGVSCCGKIVGGDGGAAAAAAVVVDERTVVVGWRSWDAPGVGGVRRRSSHNYMKIQEKRKKKNWNERSSSLAWAVSRESESERV